MGRHDKLVLPVPVQTIQKLIEHKTLRFGIRILFGLLNDVDEAYIEITLKDILDPSRPYSSICRY